MAPCQICKKRNRRAAWELDKPIIGIVAQFSCTTKNIEAWATEEI